MKKAAKKKAVKRAARPAKRRTTATRRPTSRAASRRAESPRSSGFVKLSINGQSQGKVPTEGKSLGDFVLAHVEKKGIASFSVFLDGTKADPDVSDQTLTGVKEVEIVVKDSRG